MTSIVIAKIGVVEARSEAFVAVVSLIPIFSKK